MAVALIRNKVPVNNLFSIFGNIKETSLTACLAFIISRFPDTFGALFIEEDEVKQVNIELVTKDQNRHDIVLESEEGFTVIEAKLGNKQEEGQIIKYLKELSKKGKPVKLILLDLGSWKSSSWTKELSRRLNKNITIKFLVWSEVHSGLVKLVKSKKTLRYDPVAYYVAGELINYMEVNGMSSTERKEVYCRDLKGEESVELFFRHHVYISQPKYFNSANGHRYFAPYFTKAAPKLFTDRSSIRLGVGISYIAAIKDLQLVKRGEVKEFLIRSGVPNPKDAAKLLLSNTYARKEILIFILNEPMQAFLAPINKKQLGMPGMMGAQPLTFQQLFEAVQGRRIKR